MARWPAALVAGCPSRLAYISDREGRPQIRLWREGGDNALATPAQEPLELAWSPDGASLAFTARVAAAPVPEAWAAGHPAAPGRSQPRLCPYLRASHRRRERAADLRRVADCRGEPAWMPDGRTILASTADGDLVALRLSDGTVSRLATGGRNECPLASPDGARIAWLCTQAKPQNYVGPQALGDERRWQPRATFSAGRLDRDAQSPQWSSDSRTVYFLADDRGATHAYAARSDGTVRQITAAPERLRGFSLADDGAAVTIRSTAGEPEAVVAFSI